MTAEAALGTHRVRDAATAARIACAGRTGWIATAPNYGAGTVHVELRPVLDDFPAVRVATKTGFYTRAQGQTAVEAGVLHNGQADARHSLAPDFIDWQTRRSVAALGHADFVFVNNPETVRHGDRDRLHTELRTAFEVRRSDSQACDHRNPPTCPTGAWRCPRDPPTGHERVR